MDSPSAPATPDPTAVATAQGTANADAARTTTTLNRPDQITPYGTLKWTPGDATNYNNWNATELARAQAEREADPAYQAMAADPAWKAANMKEFEGTISKNNPYAAERDKWTSTIELDPRVQALVDAQLQASQGMTGAVNDAVGRVNNLPSSIDPNTLLGGARDLTNTAQGLGGEAYGYLSGVQGNIAGIDAQLANINVNPELTDVKQQLNQSRDIYGQAGDLASSQLDRLKDTYSTDLNYDNLGALPEANADVRKRVEDALYAQAQSRLDPRFQQADNATRSTLLNRGITEGSEAWNRELENFGRERNDAYNTAQWEATTRGGEEMQRLFGMEMGRRQQGVGEANYLRDQVGKEAALSGQLYSGATDVMGKLYGIEGDQEKIKMEAASRNAAILGQRLQAQQLGLTSHGQQLNNAQFFRGLASDSANLDTKQFDMSNAARSNIINELSALRSGTQVAMPQFSNAMTGAQVAPAPIAQSAYNSYNGQMQQYGADVGSYNAKLGGLASLGGAIIGL
jgi:hypothetical protein